MTPYKPIPLPSPRLHVVLAREAPIGVILRKGPSAWVQMIKWHTDTDQVESGQWLKARVYEDKCDVSPDGSLFIYFVHKGNNARLHPDYGFAWTAISKPPYFTALALWRESGTWGGGGYFLDNKTVRIYVPNSDQHPDHPPHGLTVLDTESKITLDGERLERANRAQWKMMQLGDNQMSSDIDGDWYHLKEAEPRNGGHTAWFTKLDPPTIWHKESPAFTLEKQYLGYRWHVGDVYKFGVIEKTSMKKYPVTDATWADFDQQGRLVLAKDGKLFAGTLANDALQLTELADFNANKPEQVVAPEWAQKW